MKKCMSCKGEMRELAAKTPEGVHYQYYRCVICGEEIVNMLQLHEVAQKYREMKKFHTKVSQWGMSLGLRIPKELATRYRLKQNREVAIIPEKNGLKIIPV